jgi:hypothetical protein
MSLPPKESGAFKQILVKKKLIMAVHSTRFPIQPVCNSTHVSTCFLTSKRNTMSINNIRKVLRLPNKSSRSFPNMEVSCVHKNYKAFFSLDLRVRSRAPQAQSNVLVFLRIYALDLTAMSDLLPGRNTRDEGSVPEPHGSEGGGLRICTHGSSA